MNPWWLKYYCYGKNYYLMKPSLMLFDIKAIYCHDFMQIWDFEKGIYCVVNNCPIMTWGSLTFTLRFCGWHRPWKSGPLFGGGGRDIIFLRLMLWRFWRQPRTIISLKFCAARTRLYACVCCLTSALNNGGQCTMRGGGGSKFTMRGWRGSAPQ